MTNVEVGQHGIAVDGRHWDALLDALERLEGTGPEFGGFLANHGPMAVDALSRLGAPELVGAWADAYRGVLDTAPSQGRSITDDNWMQHLGDEHDVGDWTWYFERAVRTEDWREVVATWWPRLLSGAAASAAHGLIRTAHAIRSLATAPEPHPLLTDELARGLAYWAARYQPLPGAPTLTGGLTVSDAIRRLPRLSPDVPSPGPGISGRLELLAGVSGFPEALDAWGIGDDPAVALDDLISAAARVLANRDDEPLVYCHAVTAPAAMQMVLDEIPDSLRAPTVAGLWTVFGGLITAYGWHAPVDELDHPTEHQVPRTDDLAAMAIENGDEHVIKLTEAALRQFRRTGDTALLIAADRFRQRWAPMPSGPLATTRTAAATRPIGSSLVINVDDFDGVTAFYRDVLALPVTKLWEIPPRRGMIVELGPHSMIEFADPPSDDHDRPTVHDVEVMIEVDDAAAWLERLVAAGVLIRRELIENPWGDRSFGVDDPSGRRVWIFEVLDSTASG